MHVYSRTYGLILAVLGMIAASVMLGGPASAAPYTPGAAIYVSDSNPGEGTTIGVFGTGFGPSEPVSIDLQSVLTHLTTVTDDPNGSFATRVTLPPGATGAHEIVGTGQNSGRTASARIFIGVCGGRDGCGGGGGYGGGGYGGGGYGGGGYGGGTWHEGGSWNEGGNWNDGSHWNDGGHGAGDGGLPDTGAAGMIGISVLGVALLLGGGGLMAAKRRR